MVLHLGLSWSLLITQPFPAGMVLGWIRRTALSSHLIDGC